MTTTFYRWICGRRQPAAAAKRRAGAGCGYRRLRVELVEDRVLLSATVGPDLGPAIWDVDVGPRIERWGAEPAIEQVDFDLAAASFNDTASPARPVTELANGRLGFELTIDRLHSEPATRRFDSEIAGIHPLAESTNHQGDIQSAIDRSASELVAGRFDADAARPELPAGLADVLFDGELSVDLFRTGLTRDRFDAQMPRERPAALVAGAPLNGESSTDGLEIWPAIGHFRGQITDGQFAASPTDDGFPRQVAVGGSAIDVTEQRVDPQMPDGQVFAGLASYQLQPTPSISRSDKDLAAVGLQQMADSQGRYSAVTGFPVQPTSTPIDLGSPVTYVAANEGGFIDIGKSLSNKGVPMSTGVIGRNALLPSTEGTFSGTDLGRTDTDSITRGKAATDAASANTAPSTSRITPPDDGLAAMRRTERLAWVEETDEEMSSSDLEEGSPRESHLTAIAPADLACEESEGGLIDLTCVVNERVRLACKTPVEAEDASPGLVDGEQPDRATAEELAVDGSRGRSQVFELAMAVGQGEGADEVQRCVDQMAPIAIPEVTPPFLALPDPASGAQASSEEAAFTQSGAHETVFAEMAEERADALTPPANEENHWSASLIPLLGPVVISLGIAERTAHARQEKRRALIGFLS